MTYIYPDRYNTYFADVDANGKVNINTLTDDIVRLCSVKILPVNVDEIIIFRNGVQNRIEKSIKAGTIIFIIDEYTYHNARKLNIDVKLVYTQDETAELLKFRQEYRNKIEAKRVCETGDTCDKRACTPDGL